MFQQVISGKVENDSRKRNGMHQNCSIPQRAIFFAGFFAVRSQHKPGESFALVWCFFPGCAFDLSQFPTAAHATSSSRSPCLGQVFPRPLRKVKGTKASIRDVSCFDLAFSWTKQQTRKRGLSDSLATGQTFVGKTFCRPKNSVVHTPVGGCLKGNPQTEPTNGGVEREMRR